MPSKNTPNNKHIDQGKMMRSIVKEGFIMVALNMTNYMSANYSKSAKQKTPHEAMCFGGTWLRFGQTLTVRGQAHPSANDHSIGIPVKNQAISHRKHN